MIVTIKPIDVKTSEWQYYLACGDHHLGNIGSDVKHIKKDLIEAKERNARILIDGDVFDCIYPRDSRRYNPAIIIPELRDRADPINATVEYGFGIFSDYAENIDIIGLGNHESATMHYNSVDVIKLLIEKLNAHLEKSGSDHRICHGGYTGYLRYTCMLPGIRTQRHFDILYHHGGGGESRVTRGMIDINRKRTNWVYDLFIFGHKHHTFAARDITIKLGSKGKLYKVSTRDVQTGTYLKSYPVVEDGSVVGYEERGNHAPKPIGGVFGKWRFTGSGSTELEQRVEV